MTVFSPICQWWLRDVISLTLEMDCQMRCPKKWTATIGNSDDALYKRRMADAFGIKIKIRFGDV